MTTPDQQGYALGVDLGTSNTVAVVRSPDGRTRPLLFDGQPIMPSTVFLDDDGRMHVGRDAQRMAQLDPARCEPNPKRRIDEPSVLLGDREVPVVRLLAALLREIATKAVETVGFLPPTAITHPAAWGPTRRGVLTEAVRQAGWPPVLLVPEPIAAARYFAQVMRRPVPVGSAIAVFDFGGGTLDVAIVRNDGHAYAVVGSGGDERLGGLDLDAALVAQVGGLIGRQHPQIWRHLSEPTSTADRRYRRLFWEDVRGAKEMLSRSTTAPVPVPGVDSAVHLTREELERLTEPLLSRAVQATEQTIARAGMRPDQLAGLFLVGGSSRVPMAARMLHARLGIAPTVLEQPELPVAEGALAELAPPVDATRTDPAQVSAMPFPMSAAPASGMPVSAVPGQSSPVSGVPTSPGGPPPGPYPPHGPTSPGPYATGMPDFGPPPPAPWYKRKHLVFPGVAAVVVLLVVGAFALFYSKYSERDFDSMKDVGTVKYSSESPSYAYVSLVGGTAYLTDIDSDGKATVRSVALDDKVGDAKKLATLDSDGATWAEWAIAHPGGIELQYGTNGDAPGKYEMVNPDTGRTWTNTPSSDDDSYTVLAKAGVVLHSGTDGTVEGLDLRTGKRRWGPKKEYGSVNVESRPEDMAGAAWFGDASPFEKADVDRKVVVVNDKGLARVIDPATGGVVGDPATVDTGDGISGDASTQTVVNGMMVDATSGSNYQIRAYALNAMSNPKWTYREPSNRKVDWISPCGEDQSLVCVKDHVPSDTSDTAAEAKTDRLVVLKLAGDGKPVWTRKMAGLDSVFPVGDRLVVNTVVDGDPHTTVYDDDFEKVDVDFGNTESARVDDATVLGVDGVATGDSTSAEDWSMNGNGVQSGHTKTLGKISADLGRCEWTDRYMACPGDDGFEFWQFRK
ncbi:MAG TPA: Hsp70 family protein [Actinocatenispora sp.]